jgi:hypothetical protein
VAVLHRKDLLEGEAELVGLSGFEVLIPEQM